MQREDASDNSSPLTGLLEIGVDRFPAASTAGLYCAGPLTFVSFFFSFLVHTPPSWLCLLLTLFPQIVIRNQMQYRNRERNDVPLSLFLGIVAGLLIFLLT